MMGAINAKLRSVEGQLFEFWCPGCDEAHGVPAGRGWTWNGDAANPTVSPSLLIRGGHFSPDHKPGDPCWCTYNRDNPDNPTSFACSRCHLHIVNGRIAYCGDCSHALSGQTIPIPDWPEPA
jgi:hypothetical protein